MFVDPDPNCPWCKGEGVVDSGGFTPWDTPIDVRCGCTYPPDSNDEGEDMKKYLVSIFLIACSIPSLASDRLQDLSHAIARAEGFYTRRTIPNRLHNPGDLRTVRGYRYPGQIGTSRRGYAIFRGDREGFAALTH